MTRQDYYELLCEFGMPEIISASMAAQATHIEQLLECGKDLVDHVYSFRCWTETVEGADFWIDFKNSIP